jgi:ketosteroid isomerase-like protein
VVLDVHAAWSAGDLERMMSHYADRVDYYGVEGASKSFVRNDHARTIQRYDRRIITIEGQATMFQAPDLARVLVTKSWEFTGSGERWTGRMRGEMILRQRGNDWLIVAEKTARLFGQQRQRI